MKKILFILTLLFVSVEAVDQTVGIGVATISEIAVSGNVSAMSVSTATAGSAPDDVIDATTTYSVTTNAGTDARKITGILDTAPATGLTLSINLTGLSGSTSAGKTALSAVTASDLVTAIDSIYGTATITYTLAATVAATVAASVTKTVTLTLTAS